LGTPFSRCNSLILNGFLRKPVLRYAQFYSWLSLNADPQVCYSCGAQFIELRRSVAQQKLNISR